MTKPIEESIQLADALGCLSRQANALGHIAAAALIESARELIARGVPPQEALDHATRSPDPEIRRRADKFKTQYKA
jgi:hypothetical protein